MDRQAFSDYVRSLDPAGEPPDPQTFDELWSVLGQALRGELKKRGLWDTSPDYLGVYGYDSWYSHAAVADGAWDQALDELLAGCYSHIFVRRLGGLKAQLAVKPNIDGLVFLGIRNFLHDLQKRHDPLGFRVFEILRSAVQGALKAGELSVLGGDRRIRNDTILGSAAPNVAVPSATVAGCDDELEADIEADIEAGLEATVKSWNDTLLPELVTARGEARLQVIAVLRRLLAGLPEEGLRSFTFKQIIEPLKNDARARWGALLDLEEGESALESLEDGGLALVRRSPDAAAPDVKLEERDSYDTLVSCVSESVDRRRRASEDSKSGREAPPTPLYLGRLWEFLHTRAGERHPPEQINGSVTPIPAAKDGERLSARKLAKLLRIPRDRIPGLFTTLGELVAACRAAKSEKRPVNSLHRDKISRG